VGTELRTSAPAHATGAVEFVPLEEVAPDATFRLRDEGDVTLLAASVGRLGQLAPVELRPWPAATSEGFRWQVVSGFRRLAALRLLHRDRVLARIHEALGDEDAWALALAQALATEPLAEAELERLRAQLVSSRAAPWALELVDEALVRAPVTVEQREAFYDFLRGARPGEVGDGGAGGGGEEVEVDAEEFARDLAARMAEVNQDLSTAHEAWADLPGDERRRLLDQARWVAQLVPFLEEAER